MLNVAHAYCGFKWRVLHMHGKGLFGTPQASLCCFERERACLDYIHCLWSVILSVGELKSFHSLWIFLTPTRIIIFSSISHLLLIPSFLFLPWLALSASAIFTCNPTFAFPCCGRLKCGIMQRKGEFVEWCKLAPFTFVFCSDGYKTSSK